jgi:hypothetical protein
MNIICVSTLRLMAATFLLLAALVSTAPAQSPPPGVKVGTLGCILSPTIGLIIGSLQTMHCGFTPTGAAGPTEKYVGTFGTLGVDIGFTLTQGLAWAVYAPTEGPPGGALAGTYVGPSAEIGVGLGAGANLLFGGSGRTYALQPLSLSGQVAVNVSAGVSTMILRWAP